MRGLPATGSISFGTALVAGSILVPKPAAGITAFTILLPLCTAALPLKTRAKRTFGGRNCAVRLDRGPLYSCWRLQRFPLRLSNFQFRAGSQEVTNHRPKGLVVVPVVVEELMTGMSMQASATWPVQPQSRPTIPQIEASETMAAPLFPVRGNVMMGTIYRYGHGGRPERCRLAG